MLALYGEGPRRVSCFERLGSVSAMYGPGLDNRSTLTKASETPESAPHAKPPAAPAGTPYIGWRGDNGVGILIRRIGTRPISPSLPRHTIQEPDAFCGCDSALSPATTPRTTTAQQRNRALSLSALPLPLACGRAHAALAPHVCTPQPACSPPPGWVDWCALRPDGSHMRVNRDVARCPAIIAA